MYFKQLSKLFLKLDKYLITIVILIAVTDEVQLSRIQVAWLKVLIWMKGRAENPVSIFSWQPYVKSWGKGRFFSLERRHLQGGLIAAYYYFWRGYKKDGARFFTAVHSRNTRHSSIDWIKNFRLDLRKSCEDSQAWEQVTLLSPSLEVFNTWLDYAQLPFNWTGFEQGFELEICQGPF